LQAGGESVGKPKKKEYIGARIKYLKCIQGLVFIQDIIG
jgi:hypothetical protein